MQVILSTRNPSKVEQIKAMFTGLPKPINLISLDEAGIGGQAIEDGVTLQENAAKKVRFVLEQKPDSWVIADDTGIFIDALGGKPGVHTADWLGGKRDAEEKLHLILKELEGVLHRTATFRTVVAVASPWSVSPHLFEGEVRGVLLTEPRCKPQPQMPYSAIFKPEGSDKVFAQMTAQEENTLSHRGKAFMQARDFLNMHHI
jgi:XTP/dITP diphosphohydrolase